MSRAPKKPPLALDMDFAKALERFAKVDPNELPEKYRLKKKARGQKPQAKDKSAG